MQKNDRLLRTRMLLGNDGVKRLQKATVMVVGLGAVGGYALEILARSGIGHLILVDFDVFEESNVNRQILALSSTIGKKKTEVAKARVLEINPECVVETEEVFVNAETLPQLLNRRLDYVIDAIDALNPKCCLIEALYNKKIPFITSMGAALKTDVSYVKTGMLSTSRNCHLARFIRKRLKKRELDITGIKCVYSDEQVNLPDTALLSADETPENGRARHTIGSLPTVTAVFGITLANNAILALSGFGNKK